MERKEFTSDAYSKHLSNGGESLIRTYFPWLEIGKPHSQYLLNRHVENIRMGVGNYNNLEPIMVRWHHLRNWKGLVEYWYSNVGTPPWELSQEELNKEAVMTSLKYVESVRESLVRSSEEIDQKMAKRNKFYTNQQEYEMELKQLYYKDLMGDSYKYLQAMLVSRFIVTNNTILKCKKSGEVVMLSGESDVICRTCRGGIDETGDHCRAPEDGKDMRSRIYNSPKFNEWKRKNMLFSLKEGKTHRMYLTNRLFFSADLYETI